MLYSHVSYFTFGGIICYELLEINGPSHSHTFKYSTNHLKEAIHTHKALQGGESGVGEEDNFLLLVLIFFHLSFQIDGYMRYIHPTHNHMFFLYLLYDSKKKKTKKNYSLHKILSLISYTFRSSTYSSQKLNLTLNTPLPPKTSFSHYYFLK